MMAGAWVQTKRPPPTRVAGSHDEEQNNFCMKPVHRSPPSTTSKRNALIPSSSMAFLSLNSMCHF